MAEENEVDQEQHGNNMVTEAQQRGIRIEEEDHQYISNIPWAESTQIPRTGSYFFKVRSNIILPSTFKSS